MRSCILCVHFETSSLWAEFVNKNRCISVRLVSKEVKSIKFDNSHNSFLWREYFIDFFMWKMDPMSGFDIRLVFTLPPRDRTLQYKRCVHFWNNFPCNTSLHIFVYIVSVLQFLVEKLDKPKSIVILMVWESDFYIMLQEPKTLDRYRYGVWQFCGYQYFCY